MLASNSFTLFPVIFGLLGAIVLFIIASYDVGKVILEVYKYFFAADFHVENFHSEVVVEIVGAIDLYLMALVLYIFSFGIYELFISEITQLKQSKQSKVLEVHSLDELKDKLGKVIVMVLIVNFSKECFMQALQHRLRWPILRLLSLHFALDFTSFTREITKILSVLTLKIFPTSFL